MSEVFFSYLCYIYLDNQVYYCNKTTKNKKITMNKAIELLKEAVSLLREIKHLLGAVRTATVRKLPTSYSSPGSGYRVIIEMPEVDNE